MNRKNLKLKSVRLDPDMLEKVKRFQGKHEYWTESYIINKILCQVFLHFSESDIYDMVRMIESLDDIDSACFSLRRSSLYKV